MSQVLLTFVKAYILTAMRQQFHTFPSFRYDVWTCFAEQMRLMRGEIIDKATLISSSTLFFALVLKFLFQSALKTPVRMQAASWQPYWQLQVILSLLSTKMCPKKAHGILIVVFCPPLYPFLLGFQRKWCSDSTRRITNPVKILDATFRSIP
jgi:hypothetical protein